MHMLYFLIGIFEGIIIGILVEKYVFPYFEILFEVYTAKKSKIIANYNADIQAVSYDLMREYPEISNKNTNQEQVNVVGFDCQTDSDETDDEYYEGY